MKSSTFLPLFSLAIIATVPDKPRGTLLAIPNPLIRFKRKAGNFVRKILSKKPVHLLHIGKTGGSAVKLALEDHLTSGRYSIIFHRHNITFMDIPVRERTIFFLRDPLSRFVSSFYSRQREGRPRYFSPWTEDEKTAFEYFKTPDQLARALSSNDEGEKTRALKAMNSIGHVNTRYWDWFKNPDYCKSRLGDIFFVGFQEQLDEDFDRLKKMLRLPTDVTLPTDEVQAHKNPRTLDTALSEEAASNLKDWYRSDYEFMEFCRTNVINNKTPRIWLRIQSLFPSRSAH